MGILRVGHSFGDQQVCFSEEPALPQPVQEFAAMPERYPSYQTDPDAEPDAALLRRELEEAHKTIRTLLRQIDKEQARHAEITRAYNKTVANLMEITRENAQLERERDAYKARAEGTSTPFHIGGAVLELTQAEVSAIRKAMARLHHPDTGGDAERMKLWNAALDPLA
jgi:septal ring factor EnvC (AmiA/AmiB activator)